MATNQEINFKTFQEVERAMALVGALEAVVTRMLSMAKGAVGVLGKGPVAVVAKAAALVGEGWVICLEKPMEVYSPSMAPQLTPLTGAPLRSS